nr:MAG TPA: NgoMIV restriction enzyme [Caudoviricetes sp.]
MSALFADVRRCFHEDIARGILWMNEKQIPNFADSSSELSSKIACEIIRNLKIIAGGEKSSPQQVGKTFETLVSKFIKDCFRKLDHLRPGHWTIERNISITNFEQYKHLVDLELLKDAHPELEAVLGGDYIIKPDIVMFRAPEEDAVINRDETLVDASIAKRSLLRRTNSGRDILHASISCKWTIRSDRSQNSRTEALNMIRNRKGHLPHIIVVTAEPMPSRLASIALGTGDVDCVYHFALEELERAVEKVGSEDSKELIQTMVDGGRMKDISDLPLDLAI